MSTSRQPWLSSLVTDHLSVGAPDTGNYISNGELTKGTYFAKRFLRSSRTLSKREKRLAGDLQPIADMVWFAIDVRGDTYTVDLANLADGTKTRTTTFVNTNPVRGVAAAGRSASRLHRFAVLSRPRRSAIRQIEIKP